MNDIAIRGFVILVVFSTFAFIQSVKGDSRCHDQAGYCQNDKQRCPGGGSYKSGLCNGARSRRCCIPRRDPKCKAKKGACKITSSSSCNGQFQSGLCHGPSNRRCCVPRSGGGNNNADCGSKVTDYACKIMKLFESNNIGLWDRHPSGEKDKAYARNNIRDTCNGGRAARSSYGCKTRGKFCNAPGGSVCLNEKLLQYIYNLGTAGYIHVNEVAGACHSCTSKHYDGRAVDIHIESNKKSRSREAKRKLYMNKCTDLGGWALDEGHHIHCQF